MKQWDDKYWNNETNNKETKSSNPIPISFPWSMLHILAMDLFVHRIFFIHSIFIKHETQNSLNTDTLPVAGSKGLYKYIMWTYVCRSICGGITYNIKWTSKNLKEKSGYVEIDHLQVLFYISSFVLLWSLSKMSTNDGQPFLHIDCRLLNFSILLILLAHLKYCLCAYDVKFNENECLQIIVH